MPDIPQIRQRTLPPGPTGFRPSAPQQTVGQRLIPQFAGNVLGVVEQELNRKANAELAQGIAAAERQYNAMINDFQDRGDYENFAQEFDGLSASILANQSNRFTTSEGYERFKNWLVDRETKRMDQVADLIRDKDFAADAASYETSVQAAVQSGDPELTGQIFSAMRSDGRFDERQLQAAEKNAMVSAYSTRIFAEAQKQAGALNFEGQRQVARSLYEDAPQEARQNVLDRIDKNQKDYNARQEELLTDTRAQANRVLADAYQRLLTGGQNPLSYAMLDDPAFSQQIAGEPVLTDATKRVYLNILRQRDEEGSTARAVRSRPEAEIAAIQIIRAARAGDMDWRDAEAAIMDLGESENLSPEDLLKYLNNLDSKNTTDTLGAFDETRRGISYINDTFTAMLQQYEGDEDMRAAIHQSWSDTLQQFEAEQGIIAPESLDERARTLSEVRRAELVAENQRLSGPLAVGRELLQAPRRLIEGGSDVLSGVLRLLGADRAAEALENAHKSVPEVRAERQQQRVTEARREALERTGGQSTEGRFTPLTTTPEGQLSGIGAQPQSSAQVRRLQTHEQLTRITQDIINRSERSGLGVAGRVVIDGQERNVSYDPNTNTYTEHGTGKKWTVDPRTGATTPQ